MAIKIKTFKGGTLNITTQDENTPLCFTANEDNSQISFNCDNEWPVDYNTLVYSRDNKTWESYVGQNITLSKTGDKVYFNTPANITNHSWGNEYEFKFKISSGKVSASGTIMSLVTKDGLIDTIPNEDFYFYGLFWVDGETNPNLTSAPELTAKTLNGEGCYAYLFANCTALTTTPKISTTTLSYRCYDSMFKGCTSLTQILSSLSTTTLVDQCYYAMFYGCTSLKISENGGVGTKILEIPTGTEVKTTWSWNMFSETGGSFTGSPEIGKAYYCYQ